MNKLVKIYKKTLSSFHLILYWFHSFHLFVRDDAPSNYSFALLNKRPDYCTFVDESTENSAQSPQKKILFNFW